MIDCLLSCHMSLKVCSFFPHFFSLSVSLRIVSIDLCLPKMYCLSSHTASTQMMWWPCVHSSFSLKPRSGLFFVLLSFLLLCAVCCVAHATNPSVHTLSSQLSDAQWFSFSFHFSVEIPHLLIYFICSSKFFNNNNLILIAILKSLFNNSRIWAVYDSVSISKFLLLMEGHIFLLFTSRTFWLSPAHCI